MAGRQFGQDRRKPQRKPSAHLYVPVTPGGTPCTWLAAPTADEAWDALLVDAAHMPYKTREGFIERGYTMERWPADLVP